MFFQNTDIFIKLFSENLPYMILLIISIIGAISLFYFITQLSANQIAKINYKNIPFVKILYFVFGGLLAGVIYGLFDVSLKIFIDSDLYYLSADNIIIFELVIIIAFSLMSSFFTSVLSIFTLLGISAYNLINNTWWHNLNSHYENNINILIFLITSYLVTFISLVIYRTYLTITKRKKDKKNNILFSIIILSIIFVIYLISFNVVLVDAIYSFIFNYLMAILTFVFLMVIFKNIEKVIVDTFFLKRSIVYDDDIFVREEFASNIFLKFIKSNKISYGLLFKIIFNGTDIVGKKLGASKKTNLESEITNNFFNIIKVNKLFLKNGYNERLFFIPIDIEFNDNKKTIFKNKLFHELENTIKKVSKKYTINDKNFDISINIVGTLYGIHSCELDSLNKNIEKINLDNFLSNSKKNIFLYYGINEVEKDEWKNYQKLKRENRSQLINTKIIKIDNEEYISPVYDSFDEWEIRNINYLFLEKNYDNLIKDDGSKILLKLTSQNISSIKSAENLVKKITDNDFNIKPIYFYTEKGTKINKNIVNLFKNNNIFIL